MIIMKGVILDNSKEAFVLYENDTGVVLNDSDKGVILDNTRSNEISYH